MRGHALPLLLLGAAHAAAGAGSWAPLPGVPAGHGWAHRTLGAGGALRVEYVVTDDAPVGQPFVLAYEYEQFGAQTPGRERCVTLLNAGQTQGAQVGVYTEWEWQVLTKADLQTRLLLRPVSVHTASTVNLLCRNPYFTAQRTVTLSFLHGRPVDLSGLFPAGLSLVPVADPSGRVRPKLTSRP